MKRMKKYFVGYDGVYSDGLFIRFQEVGIFNTKEEAEQFALEIPYKPYDPIDLYIRECYVVHDDYTDPEKVLND